MTRNIRKVPRLVGKLRYLCRDDQFPQHKRELLNAANRLIITIESLNTPPERFETLTAYAQAKAVVKKISGEDWLGERRT